MAKARVSVTVDRVLLRRCDSVARGSSRSQVFEQALEKWLLERRARSLDADLVRYYSSMRADEQAEDSAWAGIAARALGETWK